MLWQPSGVLVLGENTTLSLWLAQSFVRHFPEMDGLRWGDPVVRPMPVHLELCLESGVRARSGNVDVEIREVLGRRAYATDDFPLGAVRHGLSLVLAPCGTGRIQVGPRVLRGEVRLAGTPERPTSSAIVTDAEVWQL